MNISFRTQCMIGITALICLLVTGGTFLLLQEIGPSPAALLPAERTLLLVTKMSPDMQQKWQHTLPDLQSAPFTENGPTIAALVQIGKKKEWILFDATGKPLGKEVLLMDGEKPLSSEDSYQQLRATYSPSSPWMFIRFPEVELEIAGWKTPSVPATISIGTGSMQIAWPMRMESALIGLVSEESPTTIASLSAARLGTLFMKVGSLLTDKNNVIITSLLQSWIQETVGTDVSAEYDMLPLLNGIGAMTIAQSHSGSLNVAVRVQPEEVHETSIDRLKNGMMHNQKGTQRISKLFDEKFAFNSIRTIEDDAFEHTQIDTWDVMSSPLTTTLFAENNRAWAFGNEKNLFTSLISTMMPVSESFIGIGFLDPQAIDGLLQRSGIEMNIPWELLPSVDKNIHWNLMRQGSLAVLHINR